MGQSGCSLKKKEKGGGRQRHIPLTPSQQTGFSFILRQLLLRPGVNGTPENPELSSSPSFNLHPTPSSHSPRPTPHPFLRDTCISLLPTTSGTQSSCSIQTHGVGLAEAACTGCRQKTLTAPQVEICIRPVRSRDELPPLPPPSCHSSQSCASMLERKKHRCVSCASACQGSTEGIGTLARKSSGNPTGRKEGKPNRMG